MDFFKNSSDLGQWRQAAGCLNDILSDRSGEQLSPAALEKLRAAAGWMTSNNWSTPRHIYTLSQLETGALIAGCIGKFFSWPTALHAKACFGSAEDLQQICQAGQKHGISFNFNEALDWSSRAIAFSPDLKSSGNLETTAELFKLGAYPGGNGIGGNSCYITAVRECGAEMGKVFARAGLAAETITSHMVNHQNSNNPLLYKKLREVYWEYGRYTAADHETLVEKKNLGDSNMLKIIFNFAARRVSEIYEFSNKALPPVLREFSFDDYGPAAIEGARKKLTELGGKPSPDTGVLVGKKTIIRPLNPEQPSP